MRPASLYAGVRAIAVCPYSSWGPALRGFLGVRGGFVAGFRDRCCTRSGVLSTTGSPGRPGAFASDVPFGGVPVLVLGPGPQGIPGRVLPCSARPAIHPLGRTSSSWGPAHTGIPARPRRSPYCCVCMTWTAVPPARQVAVCQRGGGGRALLADGTPVSALLSAPSGAADEYQRGRGRAHQAAGNVLSLGVDGLRCVHLQCPGHGVYRIVF